MDILDYSGLIALNCTYAGNKIIQAFRIWIRLHDQHEWEATDPDTGERTYAIDVIGRLCERSHVTSTYSPLCIRALAYMMRAEYHKSNGRDSEADYCKSVVESIRCSGYTLCKELVIDCKNWIKDI